MDPKFIAKVMEYVRKNPEILESVNDHLMPMPSDRNSIIERHLKLAEECKEISLCNRIFHNTPITDQFAVKKPSITTAPFMSMKSIRIKDLILSACNIGKKLNCTFIVDATVMTNAHSVVKDDYGDVIKVQIPNLISKNVSLKDQLDLIKKVYPNGSRISIKEPFFKVGFLK